MNSQIIYTPILVTEVAYARAFFLTSPTESPLVVGVPRQYPFKYASGSNDAATAFEMWWYANQADFDAKINRLTDTARLPSAVFDPPTPDATDATRLQDASVVLTAQANGYETLVGAIEMVQDTGDFIEPHIYLLGDSLSIDTTQPFRDYDIRYWIGHPAITAFQIEWYATRLDANLRTRQLTDADRLPRAAWIPLVPNTRDVTAETLQNGVLRLYRPVSSMPYDTAVGLLCVAQQDTIQKEGDPVITKFVSGSGANRPKGRVYPNWRQR